MSLVFQPGPPDNALPAFWFCYRGQELLIYTNERSNPVPCVQTPPVQIRQIQFLGMWHETPCWVAECSPETEAPDGMAFSNLRLIYHRLGEELWYLAGQAFHLGYWYQTHEFCGRCGASYQNKEEERAKFCPVCGFVSYPRISPAVIMSVTRGEEILLARAHRFRASMYSVLAGFVEPGESLEACVRREVKEETGIEVKQIRYFGSQPWPFPNALMVGFETEYAGGELIIDSHELTDAGWYRFDALPKVPGPPSIASRLINAFVERCENNSNLKNSENRESPSR